MYSGSIGHNTCSAAARSRKDSWLGGDGFVVAAKSGQEGDEEEEGGGGGGGVCCNLVVFALNGSSPFSSQGVRTRENISFIPGKSNFFKDASGCFGDFVVSFFGRIVES